MDSRRVPASFVCVRKANEMTSDCQPGQWVVMLACNCLQCTVYTPSPYRYIMVTHDKKDTQTRLQVLHSIIGATTTRNVTNGTQTKFGTVQVWYHTVQNSTAVTVSFA